MRIFSILLLGLLLYHTFRATATLYFLEKFHLTASTEGDEFVVVKLPISLPYTNTWENSNSPEGLIQHDNDFYNITEQRYVNDTLYTTLKTNISARERFLSIVEEMNAVTDNQATDNSTPVSSILKLLNQLATVYVSTYFISASNNFITLLASSFNFHSSSGILSQDYPVHTPPPQLS